MSAQLNEEVVERVNDLGVARWSDRAYRHTSRGRDPLSGAGARQFGGRWNPRDVFPTIYLAQPLTTCVLEFDRQATAVSVKPLAMLDRGRDLHTVSVTELEVLDLRGEHALHHVGLIAEDLSDDDWTACQAVAHAAWFLQAGGVVAPSATGKGVVIAVFEDRLRRDQLIVESTTELSHGMYLDAVASR